MRPGMTPSPRTSGASSLPSNSHCMPRQIPNSGMPEADRGADGVEPRALERRRRGEVADARDDDAGGVAAAPRQTRGP